MRCRGGGGVEGKGGIKKSSQISALAKLDGQLVPFTKLTLEKTKYEKVDDYEFVDMKYS